MSYRREVRVRSSYSSDNELFGVAIVGVFAVVIFIVTLAADALLNGWVLSILWGWFMVPTFNLPNLGIPQAIGLSIIASYLTHQYIASESRGSLLYEFASPLLALSFGWVVHQYM